MNKKTDINEVSQTKTKTRARAKPKPKHEFTEEAREGWQHYQAIWEDNKILNHLKKKYSRKTLDRQHELKQNLLNNPVFANDYEKILNAYEDNIHLDEKELKILEIFDFKPL